MKANRLNLRFVSGALFAVAGLFVIQGYQQPAQAGGVVLADAGHAMPARSSVKDSPAIAAYRAADARMHHAMMVQYSGDPDVDFMRGMIPHHQGAVDMAKVVLEYGKDPQVRKLAQGIVASQSGEIGMMNKWLSQHQPAAAAASQGSR
ncbi:DUF305 domain-containing protein [Bordetella avium]|uniref:CopM family metallochaperone n=2 Tax=Bordetella avium TaxID=521 RepID=UPI000E68A06D|nr:DUF305 domain-containing protein [Bordetella avium]RIQ46281.1 DUF305 domain-containing protein [Bordetella avium]